MRLGICVSGALIVLPLPCIVASFCVGQNITQKVRSTSALRFRRCAGLKRFKFRLISPAVTAQAAGVKHYSQAIHKYTGEPPPSLEMKLNFESPVLKNGTDKGQLVPKGPVWLLC